VTADAFEDGCSDAFGQQPGEQVLGANLDGAIDPRLLTGLVKADL
jgi:hypothetical protein